jgi:hypothetical protein
LKKGPGEGVLAGLIDYHLGRVQHSFRHSDQGRWRWLVFPRFPALGMVAGRSPSRNWLRERHALAQSGVCRFNGGLLGHRIMTFRRLFRRSTLLAAALASVAAFATPARADRCDDTANQLKNAIAGLTIGKTAAGAIYLSHPQAKVLILGCSGKNFASQLYAKSDSRKPKPAFIDLVAGAAAIVFTLPKDNMQTGAKRCLGRLGLFRDDAVTRYRRLDMHCIRTKTDASIAISRRADE